MFGHWFNVGHHSGILNVSGFRAESRYRGADANLFLNYCSVLSWWLANEEETNKTNPLAPFFHSCLWNVLKETSPPSVDFFSTHWSSRKAPLRCCMRRQRRKTWSKLRIVRKVRTGWLQGVYDSKSRGRPKCWTRAPVRVWTRVPNSKMYLCTRQPVLNLLGYRALFFQLQYRYRF